MLSKIIRRTHMYAALFLTPWVFMYALSTMAMNHREFFEARHGDAPPEFVAERELDYRAAFADDARPRLIASQILSDLGMEGASSVRASPDGAEVVITRTGAVTPRRITFRRAEGKLLIERERFRGSTFLERLHRRRGFESDFPVEDTWALSVDLVIVAMLFWVASGIWMWWELKATRRWGAAFAATGLALFGLFLFTI